MTWQQCAAFVEGRLDKELVGEPAAALQLVNVYWVPKFEEAYKNLGPPNQTSDLDKIEAEVWDKVNPLQWAVDATIDALLKKYLARVAAIWAAVGSAPVEGALAFIWPSQIANNASELKLSNEAIQHRLFKVLQSKVKQPLVSTYLNILGDSDPRLGPKLVNP